MHRPHPRRPSWIASLVLGALCLALHARPAQAQGLGKDDRTLLSSSPGFVAAVRAGAEPEVVDLRPFLPPVARQEMNDCAAWAFGYAARSYLEAVDQGWRPDSAMRRFSPTWIYNQVNGGKDEGSNPMRVLELLREQGAATMHTQPQLARDYLSPPTDFARQEAAAFRVDGVRWLPDGPAIRAALAEGHVVVCGVRTTPTFNSGRYSVYSPELHARAVSERRPGQPHGFHAMVICGYSDPDRAFLFMNSWGTQWGDQGFCRVHYDVARTFNRSDVTEHLMEFALVLVDRRRPVAQSGGVFREIDLEAMQIRPIVAPIGWDLAAGVPRWSISAHVDGPDDQLDGISAVQWSFEGQSREKAIAKDRANLFASSAVVGGKTIEVRALVGLRGNKTVEMSTRVEAEAMPPRAIEIVRRDRHWGPSVGAENWTWSLVPKMSATDWQELESIEWPGLQAQVGGRSVIRRYDHDGRVVLATDDVVGWMPRATTSNVPAGRAVMKFRDGQTYEVALPAGPFSTPASDVDRLEIEWRPEGRMGGRYWYHYELRLISPLRNEAAVSAVYFEMDTQSRHSTAVGRAVSDDLGRMFVHSGLTDRPFGVRAVVRRGDEVRIADGHVALGEHAAWPVADGYSIEFEDAYAGEFDGEPAWDVRLRIDGEADIWQVERVVWTVDGESTELTRDTASPYDGFPLRVRARAPVEVAAALTTFDGEVAEVRRVVTPTAERNDALGLQARVRVHELLAVEAPDRRLVDVSIVATEAHAASIRRIECLAPRPWGAMERVALGTPFAEAPLEALGGPVEIGAPAADEEPLSVLVRRVDGSVTEVRAAVLGQSPVPALPRAQIEAREISLGTVAGRPRWRADIELRGNLDVLAAVENVTWIARTIDGAEVPVEPDGRGRARVEYGAPVEVRARLKFRAESGREPMEIATRAHALAANDQLDVVVQPTWHAPTFWNPNVDPLDMDLPSYTAVVHLVGKPDRIARVRSVEYRVRALYGDPRPRGGQAMEPTLAEEEELVRVESGTGPAPFALRRTVWEEASERIVATAVLDDGSRVEFEPRFVSWRDWNSADLELARSVYWGRRDGTPLQLVTCAWARWREDHSNVDTIDLQYHWNEELAPGTAPAEGYPLSPDSVAPAAGGPPRSYERGSWSRSFLAPDGAVMPVARFRVRHVGATTEDSGLTGPYPVIRVAVTPVADEPVVRVAPARAGEPDVLRASIEAPESWMSQVRAVEYVAADAPHADDVVVRPFTRFDAFGESWGALLPTAAATKVVTARVTLSDGSIVEIGAR